MALKELWRSFFGCHHKWNTIRYQKLTHKFMGEWGTWAVNECEKCGAIHPHAHWQGRKRGL